MKQIVQYTTRPIRNGEKDGTTYHFITNSEFFQKVKDNFFAEWKVYHTEFGDWYYGTSLEDLQKAEDNSIIILTPSSCIDIKNNYPELKIKTIYIKSDENTIRKRLIQRGDNINEAARRIGSDYEDFKYAEDISDYIILNNYHSDINVIVSNIHNYIKSNINKKPKLFVDFDGTIVNTMKSIVSNYNEDFQYYDGYNVVKWTDIETWDFSECKCAKTGYINEYFNQKRFFDKLEYVDWAKEVLNTLHKKFNIIIVSLGDSPNLKLKKMWIEDNLPYCKFIGINNKEYNDKSHIDMSDSIFIDDSVDNLKKSNAKTKICFGDIYDWNKGWTGLRFYNWMDIYKFLMNKKGND